MKQSKTNKLYLIILILLSFISITALTLSVISYVEPSLDIEKNIDQTTDSTGGILIYDATTNEAVASNVLSVTENGGLQITGLDPRINFVLSSSLNKKNESHKYVNMIAPNNGISLYADEETENLEQINVSGDQKVVLAVDKTNVSQSLNGQILQTDGDNTFSFVDKTPLTTKGDLLGYSVEEVRIPIGPDASVLIADSNFDTGVNYSTFPITKTLTVNSDPSPASAQVCYNCDTSSGSFTVTLPISPDIGTQIQIVDSKHTFEINNLTINVGGGGNLIYEQGLSGTVTKVLNLNSMSRIMVYTSENSWVFTNTTGVSSGLAQLGQLSVDTTVSGNSIYDMNSSSGSFDVTLPAASGSGDRIILTNTQSTNPINLKVQLLEQMNGIIDDVLDIGSSLWTQYQAVDTATGEWSVVRMSVPEEREIGSQSLVYNGSLSNAFNGTRYVQWGDLLSETDASPFVVPYNCTLIACTIMYTTSGASISIGAGEAGVFDIGTIGAGVAGSSANFTQIMEVGRWDENDNLTFPQILNTDISLSFNAGDQISLRVREIGTLNTCDISATLTFITDLGSEVTVSKLPTVVKGDIVVYNGNVNVRLPVGTDNQVLASDTSATNGIAWKDLTPSSTPDYIQIQPSVDQTNVVTGTDISFTSVITSSGTYIDTSSLPLIILQPGSYRIAVGIELNNGTGTQTIEAVDNSDVSIAGIPTLKPGNDGGINTSNVLVTFTSVQQLKFRCTFGSSRNVIANGSYLNIHRIVNPPFQIVESVAIPHPQSGFASATNITVPNATSESHGGSYTLQTDVMPSNFAFAKVGSSTEAIRVGFYQTVDGGDGSDFIKIYEVVTSTLGVGTAIISTPYTGPVIKRGILIVIIGGTTTLTQAQISRYNDGNIPLLTSTTNNPNTINLRAVSFLTSGGFLGQTTFPSSLSNLQMRSDTDNIPIIRFY